MAAERLDIVVSERGAKVVQRNISDIGPAAERAQRGVERLQRMLAQLASLVAIERLVRQFVDLSNESIRLDNRLRTVTKTTAELESVYQSLRGIANETRTSLSGVVELYSRVSTSARELGRSESELLRFTRALSQEIKLSGASATEANAALIQLSQGIASGTLRGDELRSVLEQVPTVADRIAEHLGVTRGELRKLGEQGKLTADVIIDALLRAENSIRERFAKAIISPADAFQNLQNEMLDYVRNVNGATGVSTLLADSIMLVANNVEILIPLLATIGGMIVFNLLASQVSAFVATVRLAIPLVSRLVQSLLALRATQTAVAASDFFGATNSMLAGGGTAGAAATSRLTLAAVAPVAAKMTGLAAAAGMLWWLLDKAAGSTEDIASGARSGIRNIGQMADEADRLATNLERFGKGGQGVEKALAGLEAKPARKSIDEIVNAMKQLQSVRDDIERQAGMKLTDFEFEGALRDKVRRSFLTDFKFTDEELAGTKAEQLARSITEVTDRIVTLNEAKLALKITDEDYNRAIGVQREALDKLTGGIQEAIDQLRAENEVYAKFAGDQDAIRFSTAGASDDLVQQFLKEKAANEQLSESVRHQAEAQRDAARAVEQRQQASQRMLESLRQEVQLFGLTQQQRDLAQFRGLSDNPQQVSEFQRLQETLNAQQVETTVRGSIAELNAAVIQFNQVAQQLRAAVKDSPAEVQKQAEDFIREGTFNLRRAAEQLGTDLGTDIGDSARPLVEAAGNEMIALGGEIGAQLGANMKLAFDASIASGAAALGASRFALGGGGASSAGPGAFRGIDPAVTDQLRQQQSDLLNRNQQIVQSMDELNARVRAFGPTAGEAFAQASGAARGFGDTTNNIGTQINNVFTGMFSNLENALVSWVTTGKLDFKSLINAMLADLARLVIQMLIIRPLMGFFGGFFGGIFGFSQGGFVGGPGLGIPGFAHGGLVYDAKSLIPGYATGGGIVSGFGGSTADSMLARLSAGEFVINAGATRRNRSLLETINRTGYAPASMYAGASSGGIIFAPNIAINMTGSGGGERDARQAQQAAMAVDAQIRKTFVELVQKEQRPGGMLEDSRRRR